MKKILSILLSVAIILSCVSMVSFAVDGPQSENLLPAEISTFDTNGAISHESYGEVISNHTSFRDIIEWILRLSQ